MRRLWRLIGLSLLLSTTACAASTFSVTEAFSLPGRPGGVCAAYFTIDNPTDQADVLLEAVSEVAASTEIHTIIAEDGALEMKQLSRVDVPARSQVRFEPGGLHIMLIDLKRPLKAGDVFALTLHFQQRGAETIQVTVKEL